MNTENGNTNVEFTFTLSFEDETIEAELDIVKEGDGKFEIQYCEFK